MGRQAEAHGDLYRVGVADDVCDLVDFSRVVASKAHAAEVVIGRGDFCARFDRVVIVECCARGGGADHFHFNE